jgi:hypothetical protein
MNDIWEEIWDILNEAFRSIATSLSASHPEMSWSSGHSDNRAFPFRAYAAFNDGSQGSEDVVLSIDFHRSEEQLRFSSDIGCDDGTVLADGPSGAIDVSEGIASAKAEIEAAVGNILSFVNGSENVISDAINRK